MTCSSGCRDGEGAQPCWRWPGLGLLVLVLACCPSRSWALRGAVGGVGTGLGRAGALGLGSAGRARTRLAATDGIVEEVSSMRVREILEELGKRRVSTRGVLEKGELVDLLVADRRKKLTISTALEAPIMWTAASGTQNGRFKNENINLSVEGAEQAYLATNVTITTASGPRTLRLLVDTACTNTCISPRLVQELGLEPLQAASQSGIGAGGAVQFSLVKLSQVSWAGRLLGDFPGIVQDTGPLPPMLDGILGLDLLLRFHSVEIDIDGSVLRLHDEPVPAVRRPGWQELSMCRTAVGVPAVRVAVEGQGPALGILDTGSMCTVLTWKGAQQVGLARDDRRLQALSMYGAMGIDNRAIELTHRFAGASVALQSVDDAADGGHLAATGVDLEIGDLPALGAGSPFASDNICALVGTDVLLGGTSAMVLDFRAMKLHHLPKAAAQAADSKVADAETQPAEPEPKLQPEPQQRAASTPLPPRADQQPPPRKPKIKKKAGRVLPR